MTNELLSQLIEFIKNASPEVWRILQRQALLDALDFFIWATAFGGSSLALFRLSKTLKPDVDSNTYVEEFVGKVLSLIIGWIFTFLAVYYAVAATKIVLNPDYHAIMLILSNLTGQQ